jgi:hypothetical protein
VGCVAPCSNTHNRIKRQVRTSTRPLEAADAKRKISKRTICGGNSGQHVVASLNIATTSRLEQCHIYIERVRFEAADAKRTRVCAAAKAHVRPHRSEPPETRRRAGEWSPAIAATMCRLVERNPSSASSCRDVENAGYDKASQMSKYSLTEISIGMKTECHGDVWRQAEGRLVSRPSNRAADGSSRQNGPSCLFCFCALSTCGSIAVPRPARPSFLPLRTAAPRTIRGPRPGPRARPPPATTRRPT